MLVYPIAKLQEVILKAENMIDMHRYLAELKRTLEHVEAGRNEEAAKILAYVLQRLPEPPQWSAPDQPPSDFGAWHWVWLAHSALTGEEVISPELALRTAIDLLS